MNRVIERWERLPLLWQVPSAALLVPAVILWLCPAIHLLPPLILVTLFALCSTGLLDWLPWPYFVLWTMSPYGIVVLGFGLPAPLLRIGTAIAHYLSAPPGRAREQ